MTAEQNANRIEKIYNSARQHHRPSKTIWARLFKARCKALKAGLKTKGK